MIELTGNSSDFLQIAVAAAGRGDLEAVREVLDLRPHWVRMIGSHGRTMLWEAAYRGRADVVRYLAENGADIHQCGCHYTPLLIEISPLCAARLRKRRSVVEALRELGAKDDIHSAAYLGDLESLRRFLDEAPESLEEGHPQVDMVPDPRGGQMFAMRPAPWATPLHYAVAGNRPEAVGLLLQRGAQAKAHCATLLPLAEDEMLPILGIEAEPEPGLNAPQDWPPLIYLCRGDRGGNPDEVRQLLAAGADPNLRGHSGRTALHQAARAGLIDAVRILIEAGAGLESRDDEGKTPLFAAVDSKIRRTERRIAAVRLLLEAGARVDIADAKGRSLVAAARKSKASGAAEVLALVESPIQR